MSANPILVILLFALSTPYLLGKALYFSGTYISAIQIAKDLDLYTKNWVIFFLRLHDAVTGLVVAFVLAGVLGFILKSKIFAYVSLYLFLCCITFCFLVLLDGEPISTLTYTFSNSYSIYSFALCSYAFYWLGSKVKIRPTNE